MRFAIWQNGGKGQYLHQQLLKAGHTPAPTLEETQVLLLDCDWRWAHPRPGMITQASQAGAQVVLYPHGGHPTVFVYDGLTDPDPLVSLRLEHGAGSVDVARLLGLELQQQPTGWLFSPTWAFRKVKKPRRVLFAPQHPNIEAMNKGTNGHDPGPALNQAVYRQLLELGYDLTVTLVGPRWNNGVWNHPRATFVSNPNMLFEQTFALIQQADIVIGAGTVAATAVACGKPTVMFGQGNYADYIDGHYQTPDRTDVYDEMLRYPLDADHAALAELIDAAVGNDESAAEWRERFIGDDGTHNAIRMLEELVESSEPSTANVIIGGVTATAKLNG